MSFGVRWSKMVTKSAPNIKYVVILNFLLFLGFGLYGEVFCHDPVKNLPANKIFGGLKTPTKESSEAIGFYSKGCLSGAMRLEDTGPN